MAESPNGIANPAEQFQNSVMQNPEDQSSAKDAAPKNTNTGDARCVEYTRKQLYEAVWSTPCQKLAASLGLSDVALAKTCRRLNIPRPTRGYWARVAAGEKLGKTPLPTPKPGQDRVLIFDLAANLQRQKEWSESSSSPKVLEELAVGLDLPSDDTALCPVAQAHKRALEKAKTGEDGMVHLSKQDLFQCDISPASIPKLCQGLHALIVELQSRGYKFAASPENYGHLRIVKESDFVNLQCSEGMENIEREPTAADKRKPSWTWELKQTTPTGRLSFEIHARGLRGRRTWTEAGHKPLPEILGILVEKIEASFSGFENERRRQVEFEKQRKENERRWAEERAEEERRRLKRERQQKHESKLAAIAESRQQNLLTAARQWVEFYSLRAFIDHCESRWRETAGGQVTPDQIDWLQWARAEMVRLNPFAKGYPDPAIDGGFDPKSIPVGGPYPQTKTLEEQKVVEPAGESFQATSVHPQASQPPEPFPFWLLHRKH